MLAAVSCRLAWLHETFRKKAGRKLDGISAELDRVRGELSKTEEELGMARSELEKSGTELAMARREAENVSLELDRAVRRLAEEKDRKYIPGPSAIEIVSADDSLMKKALELVESNMDNSEYDVDAFVSDMAVGRTVLYGKIRECTGMSIHEFIMDIRLKRACQLVGGSSFTISEISFMTGFANPKYFSVCFKRRFGLTPSEYRARNTSEGVCE